MAQLTPQFFSKILQIEGGYQNRSDDNGNYCSNGQQVGTNMGMAAISVETWWGRCPTVAEMKALTTDVARAFYAWYFDRFKLFQIQNQELAELLMNNTMGNPSAAARVEQKALVKLGYNVSVDGVRGPQTVAALNEAWQQHGANLYNLIRTMWLDYLKGLNKPQFYQGWLKRMEKFPPMGGNAQPSTANMGAILGVLVFFMIVNSKR